ncbi:MAG: conserved hypothetical protein [Methanobrevibacter sp. CfCl-M3]
MVIYTDPDPVCPKCGSHITAKYDKGDRLINKNYPVKVTIYRCKCGGLYRTPLTKFVDKYCNYTHDVKKMGLTVNFFEHVSLTNITGLIGCLHGVTLSRQTVYNEIRKYYGKLKIKGKRKLSGNYAYDEQYIKLGGEKIDNGLINKYTNQKFKLINNYGPTETTDVVSYKIYSKNMKENIIGRPISIDMPNY